MNLRLSHCLTSIIGKEVIFVHDLKSMNAHLLILYQNLDMEIWKKIKMLFFWLFAHFESFFTIATHWSHQLPPTTDTPHCRHPQW